MRFLPRLHRRPAATAAFSPVGIQAGTRWLRCDDLHCAHLTTRHTPHGTGYRCTQCGTVKGDQP
ncbi:hypothetical protein JI76_28650 [Streptomyces anulatus]|uniref:hypothetical protein n=1 Tax=Streptomyces anulatus TaxID=1892 RepID=UPI0006DAB1AE|nr:hypothetical protein [Streptomyces anulatus]KPL29090.1 hypothetical protein JI76_28650 [Streptomyces anulatus]